MEPIYCSIIRGSQVNGCIYKIIGAGERRTLSMTSRLRAGKHPKQKSKVKPKKKELEYKPSARKPVFPSPLPPKPAENPFRYRKIPIVLGSATLVVMTAYMTYLYVSMTRPSDKTVPKIPSAQQDVSAQYDKIAQSFDDEVDSMESMMGYKSLRRKLANQAYGDVLEVSIGTGRNLEFYDWNFKGHGGVGKVDSRGDIKKGKIRSFTAVDKSPQMLEVAHEKFSKLFPGILGVRWVIADAAEEGKIPGPPQSANERSGNLDKKYDTVVQTMGLCSASDPVGLLRNLGTCVKEEGRILLLEHGRGKWEWLNSWLDKSAEEHAKKFGCWWNRDMREIVKESGMEVVKIETPKLLHGGTTWWIELKKPKSEPTKQGQKANNPGETGCSECCKQDDTKAKVKQPEVSECCKKDEVRNKTMESECNECCKTDHTKENVKEPECKECCKEDETKGKAKELDSLPTPPKKRGWW